MRFAGSDWLLSVMAHRRAGNKHVSPFGALVADILGATFQGLYHIEREVLRAEWSDESRISIVLSSTAWLATYDGCDLTSLVVLCHDACVRLEIAGTGRGQVRLVFYRRRGRAGSAWERHPTMEQAVELVRTHLLDARPLAPAPLPPDEALALEEV